MLTCAHLTAAEAPRAISLGNDGKLKYLLDDRLNRIPDYSTCGYMGGGVSIPDAQVRAVVSAGAGDAGPRIQAAIDYVSRLPPDVHGLRGAVLLPQGRYPIAGCLRITASGVILRGEGDGTVLIATGTDRRTLIQVAGRNDLKTQPTPRKITDNFVAVGATTFHAEVDGLHVGDDVLIRRPSTKEWISSIGMYQFPGRSGGDFRFSWLPGKMDVTWRRRIAGIAKGEVTIDAPLTTALEEGQGASNFGGGTLSAFTWPSQINQVGIEGLRCESEFDRTNPQDEQHAWMAIGMESVRNAWVRQVSAVHFASSVVNLLETTDAVTIEDCRSLDPVSEIGGYRRHSFYTNGQRTLFQRCHAEHGRRDFCAGYLAAGPNAFVFCDASDARDFSGTIESWASGILFDNLNTDGQIKLDNREIWDQGAGWTAANCMLWNCTAPVITVRNPPHARNWVFGCWGQFVGDGHWGVVNEFIKPDSLYLQQLRDRLGPAAVAAIERRAIPTGNDGAKNIDDIAPELVARAMRPAAPPAKPLSLRNGWLVCDGKVLTGNRIDVNWWKGRIIPSLAEEYGVNLTRFVPGRTGPGFTDDLEQLTDSMLAHGQALLAHHWGLWYDERRQDHEMVRRIDADVWPPFYEQAWARSGTGAAWDGLSKYDLTRFNPWYFNRLKQFADLCDRKGLVLVNQMYFQHNIIEAGAHWVDTPWRPANALQDLGFPEPPPFENRKRIFMADAFYDVTVPARREFHRAFIRKSLDNLAGNTNVIQVIGEEFTGPLPFVQFWIDTIAEWERETGKRPLIGLSCTKDVQDAILDDAVRSPFVSVIEMKYWWRTAGGKLFEPKGGQSLSPRQQIREWKGKMTRSDILTAGQVREYRLRYPDKAILCDYDHLDGWAVLVGGASVPPIYEQGAKSLMEALPKMRPFEPASGLTDQQWAIAEPDQHFVVYSASGPTIGLDLSGTQSTFAIRWLDPATGAVTDAGKISGGAVRQFTPPTAGRAILWLSRK